MGNPDVYQPELPDQTEVLIPQPSSVPETEFMSSVELLSSIRQRIADRLPSAMPHHHTVPGTYPPVPTHTPLESDTPKGPLLWD